MKEAEGELKSTKSEQNIKLFTINLRSFHVFSSVIVFCCFLWLVWLPEWVFMIVGSSGGSLLRHPGSSWPPLCSFWGPLGSSWGVLDPPRRLQDASKTLPRGFQDAPDRRMRKSS